MQQRNYGFSLIEMIVVIAIIGILTSIAYGSLGSARAKTRDQRRMADIANLQLSLEQFYNKNKYYPTDLSQLLGAGFLPASGVPKSPTKQTYNYFPMAYMNGNPSLCTSYQLWIELENKNSLASSSKKGFNSTSLPSSLQVCGTSTATVNASDPAHLYYDVVQ